MQIRLNSLLPCLLLALSGAGALHAMDATAADTLFDRQAYAVAAEAWRSVLRSGAPGSDDGQARLGLAESLFRLGQANKAREVYQDYLQRHAGGPREARALLGLARACASLKDYAGAARAAEAAETALPRSEGWRAALIDAEALYDAGRFQQAGQAYERLGAQWPGEPEPAFVPYARAWCEYRLAALPRRDDAGQAGASALPGAVAPPLSVTAAAFQPLSPSADGVGDSLSALSRACDLFGLAQTLDQQGRYAPGALYQQGECHYALGAWDDAARDWRAFVDRYPGDALVPAARYSLAWCRFEQGQWRDASTAFHEFSVIHAEHPLAPWALYLAGVSLARAQDWDLAESAYSLCLKRYPDSAVADRCQYGLAWLATVRKDHVAAADAWTRFLKQWGDSPLAPSASFLLADALYQQRRYAAAHDQYLDLLKTFPASSLAEDALYYAANASLAQQQWDQARDEFQQFLRLRPGSAFAPDARLRLADCQYSLGHLDAAEQAYNQLRQGAPGGPEASRAALGLGWVSFGRRDWGEAARRFKAAAAELPAAEAGEAWLRAGDALFNAADHAAAQAAYRQATGEGYPRAVRAQAHMGAGWAAYRQRDFAGAYGEWGNARSLAADDAPQAEAGYWMGWALFRQGKWADAALSYAAVAADHPGSHLVPDALVQQANSLQNEGLCALALPLYQRVASEFPKNPRAADALHGLQICYGALGREDEAVAAARAFLKLHSDSDVAPEVQYQVAEHYLERKDFPQAEKELDQLKTQFPNSKVDLTATYWRGEARFKNMKFNEAIKDWKDLVARDPRNPLAPRALFRTGLAWYRQQEYAQAEATFRQVLDVYGNTLDVAADARFNLGLTYKRMGRDEDAAAAYQAVARDYPSSELADMARIRIGYIYEDAHDYARALAAYRELASLNKGKLGAEAQYLVGDCLLATKQSGEALLAYDAVVQNFPAEGGWVVTAQARSAEVLESLGRDKEALQRYESIARTATDPTWSASARQRSALLRQRLGLPDPAAAPKAAKGKTKTKAKAKGKPAKGARKSKLGSADPDAAAPDTATDSAAGDAATSDTGGAKP